MLPSPLHQPNPHPTPPTKKSIFRGKQSNRSLIWMWRLSRAPLAGRRRRHFSQLTLLLPIQLQNKCVFFSPLLLYFVLASRARSSSGESCCNFSLSSSLSSTTLHHPLLPHHNARAQHPLSCLSPKMPSEKDLGVQLLLKSGQQGFLRLLFRARRCL